MIASRFLPLPSVDHKRCDDTWIGGSWTFCIRSTAVCDDSRSIEIGCLIWFWTRCSVGCHQSQLALELGCLILVDRWMLEGDRLRRFDKKAARKGVRNAYRPMRCTYWYMHVLPDFLFAVDDGQPPLIPYDCKPGTRTATEYEYEIIRFKIGMK